MSSHEEAEHAACRVFRDQVFHFQADEIPSREREPLEAHLDACPACARYLRVEEAFAGCLRRRFAPEIAPETLRRRVQVALDAQTAAAPRRRLRSGGWIALSVAAATVAAAAFLAPLASRRGGETAGVEAGRHVVRSAMVVDEDCDRAGVPVASQRDCRQPSHLNVLRMADGAYWSLSLDVPEARAIVADAALRGRTVMVEGDLYPSIRTLRLTRWRARPAADL